MFGASRNKSYHIISWSILIYFSSFCLPLSLSRSLSLSLSLSLWLAGCKARIEDALSIFVLVLDYELGTLFLFSTFVSFLFLQAYHEDMVKVVTTQVVQQRGWFLLLDPRSIYIRLYILYTHTYIIYTLCSRQCSWRLGPYRVADSCRLWIDILFRISRTTYREIEKERWIARRSHSPLILPSTSQTTVKRWMKVWVAHIFRSYSEFYR